MSAIKCGQCGHDNDETRVFCQNCGTRLERPEGTQAVMSGPTESPVKGKPLKQKKKKEPREGEIQIVPWLLRRIVAAAFLGFVLAIIIQLARKPDDVPAPQTPNEAQANKVYELIRTFSESPFPRNYEVTQDQINDYLATHVTAVGEASSNLPARAEFQRAFVVVEAEKMRFVVQQKHMGWPIYFYLDVVPSATGGGEGTVTGGGIGHMKLNGKLLSIPTKFVQPVFDALADNMAPINKANGVVLAPPSVKLSWSGHKKTP